MEQRPAHALLEITLEIKRLADTFERVLSELKKQTTASGPQKPPGNQSYQGNKEFVTAKESDIKGVAYIRS